MNWRRVTHLLEASLAHARKKLTLDIMVIQTLTLYWEIINGAHKPSRLLSANNESKFYRFSTASALSDIMVCQQSFWSTAEAITDT